MADREITVRVKVCEKEHGGPNNAAVLYGHGGRRDACLRIEGTNTWVYEPRRTRQTKKKGG